MRLIRPLRLGSLVLPVLMACSLLLGVISVRDGLAGSPPITVVVDTNVTDNATALTGCTAAAGDCSLRGAISRVNANFADSPNRINFNLSGSRVISPTTVLPAIALPVIVNGGSQPVIGSITCDQVFNSDPCISLNGDFLSSTSHSGLVLQGGGSSVFGMAIYNFPAAGVLLSSSDNAVRGNYLGTSDGAADAGNITGVQVAVATESNEIANNVISGNVLGVVNDGNGTVIQDNKVGTNDAGTLLLPNNTGMAIRGDDVLIGGDGHGNIISGNTSFGISLGATSTPAHRLQIAGNIIGLTMNGTAALPNGTSADVDFDAGIFMNTGIDVVIGGATPGLRNIISGNAGRGIALEGFGAGLENVRIVGNYIGTDVTGTIARGNGGIAVSIGDTSGHTVGAPGMGNVIAGNSGADSGAIRIRPFDTGANDNVIQANLIGVDATGLVSLSNHSGVTIDSVDTFASAQGNLIGGDGPGEGNVITNANILTNVEIVGSDTTSNTVAGNIIGLAADGATDLATGTLDGVIINNSSNNTIGGQSPGSRNIISGLLNGVVIVEDGALDNVVVGNYLGTDITGLLDRGNGDGIFNTGRFTRVVDNLLSANGRGIVTQDTGIVVQGNQIGLAADGSPLGNTSHGIRVSGGEGEGATIGGGGSAANEIAYNGEAGIQLFFDTSGVTITRNSIHDNGTLGIDIEPGSNLDISAPALTTAETSANTRIVGVYSGEPLTEYRFEFFRNEACDPSGFGEGETFIASEELSTNGAGEVEIDLRFATITTPGQLITATATDPDGNTSEFSNCATVVEAPATPTPIDTPEPTPTATSSGELLGDADCDGDVDLDDVIAVLQDVAEFEPGACELADANCNSQIDADDAFRILMHLAGLPLAPPQSCRAVES